MIAFGILVGLVFPPFARIVLASPRALSPTFFLMCIAAGFLVGLVNFFLFKLVVSRELARLVSGMQHILVSVAAAESTGEGCDGCTLEVTSRDAIGSIQQAFNDMAGAIARRLVLEAKWQALHARLLASVELEEIARTILATVIDLSATRAGLVYGKHGEMFDLLAVSGIDRSNQIPKRISHEYGPLNQALDTGKIQVISTDVNGLAWFRLSTPLGEMRPRMVSVIPFMTKEQPVGLAVVVGDETELRSDDFHSVEILCALAAPYLQNALLHRRIRDLAAVDDLTGILNRRFGFRRLREEFSRAVRHGVPISVMMVDVDRFKSFNDSFGHNAGDAILKMVAATLEETLRSGDIICRFGGEEFLVVTPGTGLADCARIAERARRSIETARIHWGEQDLSVTVSIGIATWPMARVSTPEELVIAADRALYAAKEAGRNQVTALQGDQFQPAFSFQDALSTLGGFNPGL
jgi:diguanylate cyclase (GGDEF)-like protein